MVELKIHLDFRLKEKNEKFKIFRSLILNFSAKIFRILTKIFVLKIVDFFKMFAKSRLFMFEPKKSF